MSSQGIYVSIALGSENILVGRLWCHYRKGRESASFDYDEGWLRHPERFPLEPALSLTAGGFHTERGLFGAFGDSAPDRWGRVLMRRAESQKARAAGESPKTLGEADYLLGVTDEARQGALRFSESADGPFLGLAGNRTIPPLLELPRLLSATERYLDDEDNPEDLRLLLAPGSSLGGARPKASVRDNDNHLAIAKFPSKHDENDVVAWEAVTLELAAKAGLDVTDSRLVEVRDKRVLLLRRFDRSGLFRVPFLSAMSMVGAADNEQRSYLELADVIRQYGAEPDTDLSQLWRRIVFSVLVSNTDDHLRNHGFLYERSRGWRLSPAYDLNPTPVELKPRILSTAISLDDATASLDLALSVTNDFRLSLDEGKSIVREVAAAVSTWRGIAKKERLSQREIDLMSTAFEHRDAELASRI